MDIIKQLISHFQFFPGVGPRTAKRYIFHLLNEPEVRTRELGELIALLPKEIKRCKKCFTFSEKELCNLCSSLHRDQSLLCVVSRVQEIESIEKAEVFHGLYFVLGGLLNPLLGVDTTHLRFQELLLRIKDNQVPLGEIILAMNPTLEGENTIHYIKKILGPLNIKLTLLARGIPQGADLEYADELTLASALRGRKEI